MKTKPLISLLTALVLFFTCLANNSFGFSESDLEELWSEGPIQEAVGGQICAECDLTGADLQGEDLTKAHLGGSKLNGANLQGANLTGASLSGANLTGANLQGANLTDAELSGADLTGANLEDANLAGAFVSGGTNLEGAKLAGASGTIHRFGWKHMPELQSKIKKATKERYLRENPEEVEKLKRLASAQKEKEEKVKKAADKKMARKNKKEARKETRKIKGKVQEYVKLTQQLKEQLEKIRTCCDVDGENEPGVKEVVTDFRFSNKSEAESLYEEYSKYLKLSRELTDPAKKEEAIKKIKVDLKNSSGNPPTCRNFFTPFPQGTTYEQRQQCLKETEDKILIKYRKRTGRRSTPQAFEEIAREELKCPVGCVEDINHSIRKLTRIVQAIEKKADRISSRLENKLEEMATNQAIKNKKAERVKRNKTRIKLTTNTKLYKELTTAFEKNFMPGSAQGSMNLLKLKMMGKSDSEVARFFEDGFNIYKNCLVDELPKRFTKTELEQMENEWGTNDLEVGSITMKCEPIVARKLEKYLLGQ